MAMARMSTYNFPCKQAVAPTFRVIGCWCDGGANAVSGCDGGANAVSVLGAG
jgi:hypothetical protein